MTETILYGIKNCDTVKKARHWLDERQVSYRFHDVRTDGLDPQMIKRWIAAAGWGKVLNKVGTTWRKLDPAVKSMSLQPMLSTCLWNTRPLSNARCWTRTVLLPSAFGQINTLCFLTCNFPEI